MTEHESVTEEDLHAYADTRLMAEDALRVEAWLRAHPDDAARVREWQAQNREIRSMFASYRRAMPGDATLLRTEEPRRARSWTGSAAMATSAICLFVAGAAAGHYLPAAYAPAPSIQEASLHDAANSAFLIYTSEVRHPVEVRADEKDHLVTWLGKRLGHRFAAPDLSGHGFSLVGGRLVPVYGKAGALLMYEDAAGKRLTIMVGQSGDDAVTSFRFAASGPVETFYWIDDRLSYAVTGEIPRETLRRIADSCYQQFGA